MTTSLWAPTAEIIEVGEGTVTLAVVVDHDRLVMVLRAHPDPDVVVRVPVTEADARAFTRVLAGSLRWLRPAPACPACGHGPTDGQEVQR